MLAKCKKGAPQPWGDHYYPTEARRISPYGCNVVPIWVVPCTPMWAMLKTTYGCNVVPTWAICLAIWGQWKRTCGHQMGMWKFCYMGHICPLAHVGAYTVGRPYGPYILCGPAHQFATWERVLRSETLEKYEQKKK